MFNGIRERLTETNYIYLAHKRTQTVFEMTDEHTADTYAKLWGGSLEKFDHFPYEEYGYEDPYAFVEEWSVMDEKGGKIDYIFENDKIVEVSR